MTQLAALLYADWRAVQNDARRVLRSPQRIGLWLLYAVAAAAFAFVRWHARAGPSSAGPNVLRAADYFVVALLITLVFSLATGQGAIGIFRSRVEARFIIGSPVATPLAIAYLQAREALGQGLRFVFSLIYLVCVFAPREIGAAAGLLDVLLLIATIAAGAAIVVPRRLVSARAGFVCAVAGIPLGLLALAPAARDAVLQFSLPAPVSRPVLALVPAWHPGQLLLEPSILSLGIVVALAAIAVAILATAGRDAYPELYALAIARLERRERRRARRGEATPAVAQRAALPFHAPRGVLAFVWKSAVEFRRAVRPEYIAASVAISCAAGFAIARFTRTQGTLFGTLVGLAVNIVVVTGIASTTVLAGELRRPLFWLSPAAVFERLCALALAQIWRVVVTLELIATGFALGGGSAERTLLLALALPILVALLAGIAFVGFALFPSVVDQRGPVAALRFVLSAFLLIPPLVCYVSVSIAFAAPLAALLGASLLMLVEAGALIGVAAWRLDGQIDRLPA